MRRAAILFLLLALLGGCLASNAGAKTKHLVLSQGLATPGLHALLAPGKEVYVETTTGFQLTSGKDSITCTPSTQTYKFGTLYTELLTNSAPTDELEFFDEAGMLNYPKCPSTFAQGTAAQINWELEGRIVLTASRKAELKTSQEIEPLIVGFSGGEQCKYAPARLKGKLLLAAGEGQASIAITKQKFKAIKSSSGAHCPKTLAITMTFDDIWVNEGGAQRPVYGSIE